MNPIRKMHTPQLATQYASLSNAFVAVMSGFTPWYAVCPECGERVRGGRFRKVAKDRLHHHGFAQEGFLCSRFLCTLRGSCA